MNQPFRIRKALLSVGTVCVICICAIAFFVIWIGHVDEQVSFVSPEDIDIILSRNGQKGGFDQLKITVYNRSKDRSIWLLASPVPFRIRDATGRDVLRPGSDDHVTVDFSVPSVKNIKILNYDESFTFVTSCFNRHASRDMNFWSLEYVEPEHLDMLVVRTEALLNKREVRHIKNMRFSKD